jgi:predicted ArsR family transcriptional regulator
VPRRAVELANAALTHGLGETVDSRSVRDGLVGALSGPAQRLLAELEVVGPRSASDDSLQASLGWTRGRLAQVFKELESAGLVRSTTDPGRSGRPRRLYEVKQ